MDINTCFATTSAFRELALYSHLVPGVASLILGAVAYFNAPNRYKAVFFFGFTIAFALWLGGDLINWVANDYHLVAATWAPLDYINIVFFALLFGFVYTDLSSRPMPVWLSGLLILSAVVPFFLTVTGQAVFQLNQPQCEMVDNEFLANYKAIFEALILGATLLFGIYRMIQSWKNRRERIRVLLVVGSIVLFMGIFAGAEYVSTATSIFEITLYSLFALPFFILFLTIAITNYETFKIGDKGVQVLFYIFILIGGAEFFFVQNPTDLLLTILGFAVTLGFGALLFQSAKREIRNRHEIEELAGNLEAANARLKELDQLKSEFLSIASHQLRAPLTAIRGYASLVVQGDYGTVPEALKEPLDRIAESSRVMASSIEDYLNISRIEQGRLKYEMAPVALGDLARKVTDELRPVATEHGLALTYLAPPQEVTVTADVGKVKQVITNLVDNAIKYTPAGSVSVAVERAGVGARVTVSDTGIGIGKDEIGGLFEKFKRARDANKVNTTGTGLGLYVAKQLVEGHKGKIWIESEGTGKGTKFIVELPA